MKRYRVRKIKPGQLAIYFGKAERGDIPDIVYGWGDGCSKRDGALLHYMIGSKRMQTGIRGVEIDPSLLEELESRGYDLTTLKFSIQKRPVTQGEP
jgi:hypothetical protein